MGRDMARRTKKEEQNAEASASKKTSYVMFGYNKDDIDQVGYFSEDLKITDDVDKAKVFKSENVDNLKGFGTPEQWLEFINSDDSLNQGYIFHLV